MHPFEAMAEPVRRRIVDILASGEHTSGEIAAVIGHEFHISRTAVSKHLRVLRDAGFVDVRGDLQYRFYWLIPEGIRTLAAIVDDLQWKHDRRLGWDADLGRDSDPLAAFPPTTPVPRKGPGRPPRRGTRGTQTTPIIAADPDQGLYLTS